jgi:hypothetical protein
MPKLPIMRGAVLLALPGLLLTACARPALRLAPQTPLCPEPLPAPLDDRSGDPAAVVALRATSTSAPTTAPASPKCIRTPSP